MDRWVQILNQSRGGELLVKARWCQSYWCRMRGLMFRRELSDGEGLLLVNPDVSVGNAAIHMFGVFYPLGVVWIGESGKVVDEVVARPWRVYFPKTAAKYVLEGRTEILEGVEVGETLQIQD